MKAENNPPASRYKRKVWNVSRVEISIPEFHQSFLKLKTKTKEWAMEWLPVNLEWLNRNVNLMENFSLSLSKASSTNLNDVIATIPITKDNILDTNPPLSHIFSSSDTPYVLTP